MNEENSQAKKKISPEHKNTFLTALFNTQRERDKQLLTLSSSAIVLLVTLLRIVGVSNLLQIIFFSIALIAFLVTVLLVLETLRKNADYINEILENGVPENNKYVCLDQFATKSFSLGIIMVVVIGIYSAIFR